MLSTSTPTIAEFDPTKIPKQLEIIKDIRKKFDYSIGVHEVLLSGSVGSAKSLLMAHIICTHAMLFGGARIGIGRLTMPSLRSTLFALLLEHLADTVPVHATRNSIEFINGSTIELFSWRDKNYKKVRSKEFSLFAIEELTENEDIEPYNEILGRIRLPHVPEKVLISATNPDDPTHWVHKDIIMKQDDLRHVYFSKTSDNIFLPASYEAGLRRRFDPRMAKRMIDGEWISIHQDALYYAYNPGRNFRQHAYKIDPGLAIHISYDFNIGVGKPMSAILYQVKKIDNERREYHFFDEIVVEGVRTENTLEELASRDIFEIQTTFLIHGDATGNARNPAAKHSNYEIISQFLANYKNKKGEKLKYKIEVPRSNPPLRTRHNQVNAAFLNAEGISSAFIYEKCRTADEGFRLTRLKPGGQYIEDDSKSYQHITTAVGYGIYWENLRADTKEQGTVCL